MSIRRKIALWICPELAESLPVQARAEHVNKISALMRLVEEFQGQTGMSDWEIASHAGVNNRAIHILKDGRAIQDRTSARLFEYFEEFWPEGLAWPLQDAVTAQFGTILVIPAVEKIGGNEAMLSLILASGRKRTIDAVQSWPRRSGMPEYARYLAQRACEERGIALSEEDFSIKRLSPAQITKLRPTPTDKKDAA